MMHNNVHVAPYLSHLIRRWEPPNAYDDTPHTHHRPDKKVLFDVYDYLQQLTWRGSELPVWEKNGSNKRPDEKSGGCPLSNYSNPHRRPAYIHKLPTLTDGGWPAGEKHRRVHASQGEDEMEKGVGVGDWPSFILLLVFLLICLAEGKKWFVWTYDKKRKQS